MPQVARTCSKPCFVARPCSNDGTMFRADGTPIGCQASSSERQNVKKWLDPIALALWTGWPCTELINPSIFVDNDRRAGR